MLALVNSIVWRHGCTDSRLINWGSTANWVSKNFVDLLLTQEILPIRHISDGAKLSQVHLLSHTAYHVLFFCHFYVETLLLHLHCSILNLLLVGLKERFEYLRLNLTQTITTRRSLPIIISLLNLLKLLLDVVFQLISSSNQVLMLLSHCVDTCCQD